MPIGMIRIKTLVKFLGLCELAKQRNRLLTLSEIIQEIHCSRGHAYNYRRALRKSFPPETFDPDRPRELAQECLT